MILCHMAQNGTRINPDEFMSGARKNINLELVNFFKRRNSEISDSSIKKLIGQIGDFTGMRGC